MYGAEVVSGARPGFVYIDDTMLQVIKRTWNRDVGRLCKICDTPARIEPAEVNGVKTGRRCACECCREMGFNFDYQFKSV